MIDAFLAFAAGVLTIASPCVLPVLPMLLAGSVGESGRCARWRSRLASSAPFPRWA